MPRLWTVPSCLDCPIVEGSMRWAVEQTANDCGDVVQWVWVRDREWYSVCVCVCVCEREGERERERERERYTIWHTYCTRTHFW